MKKIKLFLASSKELQIEREQIEIFINRKNKEWIDKGIFLDLQIWEDFLDAMSQTRSQDEYNNAIKTSDIFVMLFFSKVGKYTEEEFITAYDQFKSTNRPLIFTYFKDAPISSSEINQEVISLLKFQDKMKELEHFYTKYKSVEDLKLQINNQLNKLEENGVFVEKLQDNATVTNQHEIQKSEVIRDFVDRYLSQKLDDALQSYSNLPKIWIEPILNERPEASSTSGLNSPLPPNVDLLQLLNQPKSTIIKALPQFGLTCLAYYLCREAWRNFNSYWLYLDSKQTKHYSFEKSIVEENKILGFKTEDIKCIILDSWSNLDKNCEMLLEKISAEFSDIPIIVMQTVDETQQLFNTDISTFGQKFDILYLWTLPRGRIRELVSKYNERVFIGETDKVLSRLISDLVTFNLPRTPINCLTLLKAFEADFDESPINRYELINRVLFLLFNAVDIPTYKNKPDLKDCEYVLGYFCETMIRENKFSFTREFFLEKVTAFCEDKIIDLDVQVVFDVLHINNILIERGSLFCFRFTYWIFYFSAKRMHHEPEFASYILQDMRYTSYPEIIEFYTGIDRKREDALKVLIDDVQSLCDTVEEKCGFPKDLNPYKYGQWKPSKENIEKMRDELNKGVKESNLPDFIKDQYADSTYDKSRPYHQEVQKILTEYSLLGLWYGTKAASRALRNSDYANPELKRDLLRIIMRSWEQVAKVLFVLSPMLAISGSAEFEGATFWLDDNFNGTRDELFNAILISIPSNVHSWYQDDLYSKKIGSLIIDQLNYENSDLINHNLHLLIISQRPRDWENYIQKYIASNSKNSFYLMDTNRALQSQYKYSFASYRTLETIKDLIKMTIAKHQFGVKEPSKQHIKKISDKVIDKRDEESD
ncbi:MAG: hypothetical protein HYZ25_05335 [Chloroflexi bacterium]|nr:hypothetical protein [Chloroflexota bacterium]